MIEEINNDLNRVDCKQIRRGLNQQVNIYYSVIKLFSDFINFFLEKENLFNCATVSEPQNCVGNANWPEQFLNMIRDKAYIPAIVVKCSKLTSKQKADLQSLFSKMKPSLMAPLATGK